MPTPTYDLIASNVLGSSASSVTFSSIPATYRDLVLVINYSAGASNNLRLRFNSDSGTNYSYVSMSGDGSNANSYSGTSSTGIFTQYYGMDGANERVLITSQILDYAATDKHKTVLIRHNNSSLVTEANANRWASTSAINTILISCLSTNMAIGSSFYLYGIAS